jgi:F420-dependent oxidoreductase-like protein
MELRIFTEPQQGATYDDLLAVAAKAESCGYGAFFRSDHYLKMGSVSGLPGPTDAWITLAGLARDTSVIRLGTLLSAATFRNPGQLAIAVAEVDSMSGGRVELGLGAGWYEAEHKAYGIPFPALGERFERLEEQFDIVTGLWSTPEGDRFEYRGSHYTLEDSPALPKPVQLPHPPLIVGGHGKRRTPRLAARHANEFNVPFAAVEECSSLYDRVRAACDEIGRPADEITMSAALVLCCGSHESELGRRAAAIGRDLPELREHGAAGTPDEVVAKLETYASAGASRVYLQVLDLSDLDQLDFVAAEVLPRVA